jgi:hypothetical protein
MRINRIPTALRSIKIVDLIDRYAEQLDQPAAKPVMAAQSSYQNIDSQITRKPVAGIDQTRQRGMKRSRHVFSTPIKLMHANSIQRRHDGPGRTGVG